SGRASAPQSVLCPHRQGRYVRVYWHQPSCGFVCDNNAVGFHGPRRRDKWVWWHVSSEWCARRLKGSSARWLLSVHISWSMAPSLMCAEGWVEQGLCSTPALWLLLVAPLTIGKFVAPPRTSFAVVEFHLDIMFVAPPFLLSVFLGLLNHRKPLEQCF